MINGLLTWESCRHAEVCDVTDYEGRKITRKKLCLFCGYLLDESVFGVISDDKTDIN